MFFVGGRRFSKFLKMGLWAQFFLSVPQVAENSLKMKGDQFEKQIAFLQCALLLGQAAHS